MEDDTAEADLERLKNRLRQLSGTRISCQNLEDALQDWMAWCIDWLQHEFNHLTCITEEMAPLGLRNWAYDMCLEAWESTQELRGLIRKLC